ncbi:hypothetical protein TMatcc_007545 [Talaromyces marneffei ATCC 18224]|uniref:uncharacterized protein n=1 Tax=Talaromyces marneffei TaxID=37727 RepID=UPI0012A7AF9C|nr:uncharacterized protein EYB26_004493 [Talaromyces marneffei]KAE8553046.1 hypothetical protein EYB25_004425 [Talaromyces marneffei]QGA16823.1 hypothetical protein EYB26_004493 [Talaromyces marneffei]
MTIGPAVLRFLSDCVQDILSLSSSTTSLYRDYAPSPKSKSFSPRALSPCFPLSCEPVLAAIGKKALLPTRRFQQEIRHPYIGPVGASVVTLLVIASRSSSSNVSSSEPHVA